MGGGDVKYEINKVREVIKNVVSAASLGCKTERGIIFRRHIKNILYSKDAIEVNLLYAANDREFPAVAPFSAALFCRRPKKRRRKEPPVENRASFGVCDQEMVELAGVEPASGGAAAQTATSVASIFYFPPGCPEAGTFGGDPAYYFPDRTAEGSSQVSGIITLVARPYRQSRPARLTYFY